MLKIKYFQHKQNHVVRGWDGNRLIFQISDTNGDFDADVATSLATKDYGNMVVAAWNMVDEIKSKNVEPGHEVIIERSTPRFSQNKLPLAVEMMCESEGIPKDKISDLAIDYMNNGDTIGVWESLEELSRVYNPNFYKSVNGNPPSSEFFNDPVNKLGFSMCGLDA